MANNIEKPAKIKAIAFDFDGVMANLDLDWKATIHQASVIAGYDVKSLILFYEECFGNPIFQKISNEMEKLELQALKTSPILPYVEESIQKLAKKGVDLYIVSMQSKRVIKEFLTQHGLTCYFKDIVTREKCPGKKAQVQYVLKIYDIKPSQLLFIDDSKRNINLCSELGVSCFHFQNKIGFLGKQNAEIWDKLLRLFEA
jgi:HAD superfamily hydrolase (TIGR01509 family)